MIVTFQLDDDGENHKIKQMLKAEDMAIAFSDIYGTLFRPARKHGYDDERIKAVYDEANLSHFDLVDAMRLVFFDILKERGIDLDDLVE